MFKFNYGEYIFQQLVTSEFVQKKLAHILIALVTNFIQLHIVTILCVVTTIHPYIDFFSQIAISVFMALNNHHIYRIVEHYEAEFFQLTQYLIDNYSIDNYRYWKRCVTLSGCMYVCFLMLFVQLTNGLVMLYIAQYACCFLIVEQFEQHRVQKWLSDLQTRPTAKLHNPTDPAEGFLIESYLSPREKVLQRRPVTRSKVITRSQTVGRSKTVSREPRYSAGIVNSVDSGSRGLVRRPLSKGITD